MRSARSYSSRSKGSMAFFTRAVEKKRPAARPPTTAPPAEMRLPIGNPCSFDVVVVVPRFAPRLFRMPDPALTAFAPLDEPKAGADTGGAGETPDRPVN